MIISRTPLRVSFFGGGSDLPGYYRRHGGAVLSTAIDQSVYVTVSRKFDRAIRVSYSRTEEVNRLDEIKHPLVREALRLLDISGGVEITSVADVPARGTGLGSSSSFTVGLLNALHAYCGRHSSADALADESCRVEIDRCAEPIGKQDQYAAAFGGFNFIRFNPDDTVNVKKFIGPPGTLGRLQEQLMFFYTGITRPAASILTGLAAVTSRPGTPSAGLSRLVRMAEEAFDEICAGEIGNFGRMLDEAWRIKRELTEGVSSNEIDDAYDAAMAAGALGGKLLGAGGGGFLMFNVPAAAQASVRGALCRLRETPFRFASQGSNIIFVH